jgi:membrane protease YdiL (CAAX protease family)
MDNALLTLIFVLPFVLAVLLANMAERNNNVRVLQYVYLFMLNGFLFVAGISSLLVGMMPDLLTNAGFGDSLKGADWTLMGTVLMVGTILALVLLLPPVRRLAAKIFNIDPHSIVHATALSLTATAIALNLYQIGLNSLLFTPAGQQAMQQSGGATYMDILVFPLLTLLVTAFIGVGWLTRRSWPEVVERLGLTMPTLRQVGLALVSVVGLLALAYGVDFVWSKLDPASQQQVGGVSNALMGNFTGISGAFAVGITAAIGEETFFRGAYLPRMGIIMSALLFASFHVQYFISFATLLVLIIGLVLGVLRKRTSLTVCIMVHFLYNFVAVLLGA